MSDEDSDDTRHRGRIQAVYFDVGGVIIDDPVPAMAARFVEELRIDAFSFKKHAPAIAQFQRGGSEEQLWKDVAAQEDRVAAAPGLWLEGIKKGLGIRQDVIAMAATLQQAGIRIGVLSNTERPAVDYFLPQFTRDIGLRFDSLVLSCDVGCVKPEDAIYAIAELMMGVSGEELLFLDDREENVVAARNRGWQAEVAKSSEDVRRILDDHALR
ncbi:hypothetical protein AUJ68_03745 [Candidatus Woesearchaeota archaeon CG1_02_57_44]|nr:MAG: hypothetical protein AUJ68_03745 [Candidatus Woesearchaeota archaeon CG1_02_57_44]